MENKYLRNRQYWNKDQVIKYEREWTKKKIYKKNHKYIVNKKKKQTFHNTEDYVIQMN